MIPSYSTLSEMLPKPCPRTTNFILWRFLEEMETPDPRNYTEIPKQKRKRPAHQDSNQRPVKVPKQSIPKTPQPRRMMTRSRKSGDLLGPSPTTVPPGSHSPPSPAPKTPKSAQYNGCRYRKRRFELWVQKMLKSESDPTKKQEVLEE